MTWRRRPLKQLASVTVSNVDKTTTDGDLPVRLVNYTDVYYGDRLLPDLDLMSATATPRQAKSFGLRPDDVVITKDSETAGDIGVPAYVEATDASMVLGYHLALLRPHRSLTDGRFLYWTLCGDEARGQLATGATGVTRFGLRTDVIGSMTLPAPSVVEQRAIADFLDTETARIDALIAKKRRLIRLSSARRRAKAEQRIRSLAGQHGETPLKRLVDGVTVGIVVRPSTWYVDDGVPALRGINVHPGHLDLSDIVHISEVGHLVHAKSELRAGDVVAVRTGQAGAAAVVPDALEGVNCIDLLIIRPGRLNPEFLTEVLNSDWTQKHIEERSVGSIQSHFNVETLREVAVPRIDNHEQLATVEALRADAAQDAALAGRLARQTNLLQEHRQALITAAVTGEMNVPGVAA